MTKTPPKRYRLAVHIRGSTTQYFYTNKIENADKLGIKELTSREPGWGNTWPLHYMVQEQVRVIDGNSAEWKTIKTVTHAEAKAQQAGKA